MTAQEFYRLLDNKQIPQLVLLYGQEPYLVQRAAKALRQTLFPTGEDAFNDSQFAAKDVRVDEILEALMTLPVFAERRLVTIKEAQLLPAAVLDGLLSYLHNPVAETCFLLLADKIDARRKFYQQFKKLGATVEFKRLSGKEVPGYVEGYLKRQGRAISTDALNLFCSLVGENLHEIHAELDKLNNYVAAEGAIEVADVQAVVSRGRAENIFELGNAVGRGDAAKALTLVKRLQAAGEAPLKILALLVRHFRQLWMVRELQVRRQSSREIARTAGVPFFAVEGLIQQGRRFSRRDFVWAQELFLETDLAMKSSGADDALLLDNLILQLARKKSRKID
jgi:DNA polymerase-3 subunit delta